MQWQAFLGKGPGFLEEMHSTIMLPAPHSPLKQGCPPRHFEPMGRREAPPDKGSAKQSISFFAHRDGLLRRKGSLAQTLRVCRSQ
jgi:hypothetical protein